MVVLGGRPILVLERARDLAPAPGAGGRRQVVAGRVTGQPFRERVVEGQGVQRQVVRRELERRIERRHPAIERSVRDVVQQVQADRRDARLARRTRRPASRRRARWRRPSRVSVGSAIAWAPSDSRVTPARRMAAASPRSSGPGLASMVISAFLREPEARADVLDQAGRARRSEASTACRRPDTACRAAAASCRMPRRARRRAGPARRGARRGTRRSGRAVPARPRPRRPRSRSTGRARRRTGRGRRAPAGAVAMPPAVPPSPFARRPIRDRR